MLSVCTSMCVCVCECERERERKREKEREREGVCSILAFSGKRKRV